MVTNAANLTHKYDNNYGMQKREASTNPMQFWDCPMHISLKCALFQATIYKKKNKS